MLAQNKIPTAAGSRRRVLGIVLGLVLVLGIGSGFMLTRGEEPWQPDYSRIKTGTVAKQTVDGNIVVTGVLDTDSKAAITSPLPGTVAQVMVKEGSSVKKGDVLFTLDQKDLQVQLSQAQLGVQRAQNALDQAKLGLDNAQVDYARNEQLYNAGGISQQVFEQVAAKRDLAQAQYDAAKIGLDTAQEAVKGLQLTLAKTTVTSPIDGVVATCSLTPRDNVAPGMPLISIVAPDSLSLSGMVSEADLQSLQPGQTAEVTVDSLPGTKFAGTVSFISPLSIPTGQLFPVKIVLNNQDGSIKPGMTASAKIHTESKNVLAVPNGALFRRDGLPCVYVVRDGKAVKTEVQVGLQGTDTSVIVAGLKEGDTIVTQGTDVVMNGMKLPQ